VVLESELLRCLVAAELVLDDVLARAVLADGNLLLPLGRHRVRGVDLVGDVLPRELADRSSEAVLARGGLSEGEYVRLRDVANIDDVARRAREISFLLRAVQDTPDVLDRGIQLVSGGYPSVSRGRR
jgi:hypothetical protein